MLKIQLISTYVGYHCVYLRTFLISAIVIRKFRAFYLVIEYNIGTSYFTYNLLNKNIFGLSL